MVMRLRTAMAAVGLMLGVCVAPAVADVRDDLKTFVEAQASGELAQMSAAARALSGADFATLGLEASDVRQLRSEIADALAVAGDNAEAASIYRAVIAEAEADIDADASLDEAAKAGARAELEPWLRRLAELEIALGRLNEAEAMLAQVQSRLESQLGLEHPKIAFVLEERLKLMDRMESDSTKSVSADTAELEMRRTRLALEQRLDASKARIDEAASDLVFMGGARDVALAPKPADAEDAKFQRVRVFYGSNRARTGDAEPDTFYGSDAADLELGAISITVPKARKLGEIKKPGRWDRQERPDRAKYFVIEAVRPFSGANAESQFGDALNAEAAADPAGEVMVFIHGYNTDFQGAAFRTAQLAVDLDLRGPPVMYTWPSKAKLTGYVSDATDNALLIERDLSRFLRLVVERSGAKRLNVVAHSMGNLHLLRALKALESEGLAAADGSAPFDHVVWASPDVPAGDFGVGYNSVRKLADGMTLYASSQDKALTLSSIIRLNDVLRAGDARPPLPIALPNLVTVDTSGVAANGLGHDDYAGPALDDFRAVIWFSLSPDARCPLVSSTNGNNERYWALLKDQTGSCASDAFSAAIQLVRERGASGAAGFAQEQIDALVGRSGAEAQRRLANWQATLEVIERLPG